MSKRILSLVLVLVMVLGTFSFAFAAVPSDVVDTEYEEAVERLSLLGILEGYPDGTFRPEAQITRAEFAAVAVRVKGMEAVAEASKGLPTGFTDVPAKHWASGYVGTAAKLGIVEGVGNNKFDPEAPVKYEEAITMIVRALGYEPAAKEKGGYPFGYLIVANDIGLLEGAKGVQGLPATRGFVAQITDNALEIPMMIQEVYGPGAKWVVSGTEGTKVKALLDEMGFAHVEGLVESVNVSKNTITVDGKTLKVEDKNFDYNYAEGMQVKAWYKGNALVTYAVTKEALVGVAEGSKGKIEVAGDDYDVARGATLVLDGKKVEAEGFKADYAKVALNADNEIVWAKGYTLPYYLVVAEVKDNVAYDYNKVDVNLKGYTILKDGKTISVEDVEELDILLYNKSEKFAIVYNDSKKGKIERVYSDSFRFEGKVYDIQGMYLDGKAFGELKAEHLDGMKAKEEEVEVFFNTKGKVVLVIGDRGVPIRSEFYGLVTHSQVYTGRKGKTLGLDVRNKEGKVLSYDIVEKGGKYLGTDLGDNSEGAVLLVTVDKDENLKALKVLDAKMKGVEFKLNASYVGGKYKLEDSTIIYYGTNKVAELGDIENFKTVKKGDIYTDARDRVVVVVAHETDAEEDVEVKTDLVTTVRRLRNGTYEFTFANGDRYLTQSDKENKDYDDYKNKIVKLTIGKKSGLVVTAKDLSGKEVEVVSRSTGSRTIKTINDEYELVSGAKLYDVTNPNRPHSIDLIDLEKGDKVKVYFDTEESSRFVRFVVRVPKAAEPVKGVVTYINVDENLIKVDNKILELAKKVELLDADGKTLEIGKDAVIKYLNGLYKKGDVFLDKITEKDGVVTEMKLAKEEGPEEPEEPGEKTLTGTIEKALAGDTILVDVKDASKVEKVTSNGENLNPDNWEYGFDGNTVRIPVNGEMKIVITIDGVDYKVIVK